VHAQEIKELLEIGSELDDAVGRWGAAMLAANTSHRFVIDSAILEPVQSAVGFVAKLHGLTLVPSYTQVKTEVDHFPSLLGQVSICFSDHEGRPGEPLFRVLINRDGRFSLDGTENDLYGIVGDALDHGRFRFLLTIAEKVQGTLKAV
jgi:hypothetical protein